ncbi:MAG: hydrogenase expression/synthesis HypA [Acidobacteriaceae bacterium]|nr:hydrogenase expression/synthesis HypA [Acidobacteriaceae bacterium]
MHELSVALSIIEGVMEESERRGGLQVAAVHLKLGPLSGVSKDALLFSYDLACNDTPLEGSHLVIEEVPAVLYCPTCEAERRPPSLQDFFCPASPDHIPQVLHGRELEISALELQG